MIITADDVSYLSPMMRLYEHGSIYTSETEKWTSIVRTPGYGLIYFGCLQLSPNHPLVLLKWLQYLLFALSVPALYQLLAMISTSRKASLVAAFAYGCFPISHGFLAYTLTEAVTPALLIFSYYFVAKALKKPNQYLGWVIAVLLGSWLVLVRPALGLMLLPLIYFVWKAHTSDLKRLAFLIVLLILPLSSWQIRHKIVLGSFQSLHPIYQNEVQGMHRLPHQSFWQLVKSWEHKSEHFHTLTGIIWGGVYRQAEPLSIANQVMGLLPKHVIETIGKQELEQYLVQLQTTIKIVSSATLSGEPLDEEKALAEQAHMLTRNYRRSNWMNFAVITPFRVYKELALHSNLPYYAVQGKYRGLWWVETLRWLSFVLHSLTISALLIIPMYGLMRERRTFSLLKSSPPLLMGGILIITSACYIGYLMFVQRGVEERYTLPVLWIGWMALLISTNWIKNKRPFDFHQQKKFL